ncbi:MAG: DUF1802 family protein [Armatimonadetes bacterium]|nr:DUF1802 family protein [Akkermansiaceae bacterium]
MPVGFKEWQVVCDALGNGRQSILIRKGGIHEGRAGFSFAHNSFYLFPTRFHSQYDQVREGSFAQQPEWQVGDTVLIAHHAKASLALTITNWTQIEALFPYHIYKEQTLRERFDWEGKGMASSSIHLALIRVSKLKEPLNIQYQKSLAGCRSWVDLPEVIGSRPENAVPVMNEDLFNSLYETIAGINSCYVKI